MVDKRQMDSILDDLMSKTGDLNRLKEMVTGIKNGESQGIRANDVMNISLC